MIDWNQPIYHARTGAELFVLGVLGGGSRDELVGVQDRAGKVLTFTREGKPVGHIELIQNGTAHMNPIRRQLASIVLARANQLLDQQQDVIENSGAWGLF